MLLEIIAKKWSNKKCAKIAVVFSKNLTQILRL